MSDELNVDVAAPVVVEGPKEASIGDLLASINKIGKIISKFTDPTSLKLLADFIMKLLDENKAKANAASKV